MTATSEQTLSREGFSAALLALAALPLGEWDGWAQRERETNAAWANINIAHEAMNDAVRLVMAATYMNARAQGMGHRRAAKKANTARRQLRRFFGFASPAAGEVTF